MYTNFGMYGPNPHYTLAETPYARMTGMLTPMSESMFPGTASYLQPTFVDMNPYFGNSGIPRYPSFIGATAMQNPQIPIMPPGYSNYPQQGGMMPGGMMPGGMMPPQQGGMMPPQQGGMMPGTINQTTNNYYINQNGQVVQAAPPQSAPGGEFAQFGEWLGQLFGNLLNSLA